MSLVAIIVILIVIGFLLGIINRYIPMASSIKSILNAVVVIAVIIWLLTAFGIIHGLSDFKLK
jgi:hypothetical protein